MIIADPETIDWVRPVNPHCVLNQSLEFFCTLHPYQRGGKASNFVRYHDRINGYHGTPSAVSIWGGSCWNFNGSTNAIDFGQIPALKPTGDFSAICRFTPVSNTAHGIAFGCAAYNGASTGWTISRNFGSGNYGVRINSDVSAVSTALADGTEAVMAFSRTASGGVILYLNGVNAGTATAATLTWPDGSNVLFGARNGASNGAAGDYYAGRVVAAAAWSRVLSPAQMKQVSNEFWTGFPNMLSRIVIPPKFTPQAGSGGSAITPRKSRRQRTSPALLRM